MATSETEMFQNLFASKPLCYMYNYPMLLLPFYTGAWVGVQIN